MYILQAIREDIGDATKPTGQLEIQMSDEHMYAFRDISWADKGRLCRRIGGTNYIHPSSYTGRYWGCYKKLYAPRESNEFNTYGRRALLEEEAEDNRRELSSQRCPRG